MNLCARNRDVKQVDAKLVYATDFANPEDA